MAPNRSIYATCSSANQRRFEIFVYTYIFIYKYAHYVVDLSIYIYIYIYMRAFSQLLSVLHRTLASTRKLWPMLSSAHTPGTLTHRPMHFNSYTFLLQPSSKLLFLLTNSAASRKRPEILDISSHSKLGDKFLAR